MGTWGQHIHNQTYYLHLQTQSPFMSLCVLVSDLTTTQFPKPESWRHSWVPSSSPASSLLLDPSLVKHLLRILISRFSLLSLVQLILICSSYSHACLMGLSAPISPLYPTHDLISRKRKIKLQIGWSLCLACSIQWPLINDKDGPKTFLFKVIHSLDPASYSSPQFLQTPFPSTV